MKNQLRIGNFVQTPSGIARVSEISASLGVFYNGNGTHISYPYIQCSSIPITAEWLLKLGFIIIEDDYYEIGSAKKGYCFEAFIGRNKYFKINYSVHISQNSMPSAHNPIYVHQLQNLFFAIVGKELIFSKSRL